MTFGIIFSIFLQVSQSFYEIITSYSADKSALERKYTLTYSESTQKRFNEFYSQKRAEIDQIDFNKLSQDEKVDYILLKNLIDKNRYYHLENQKNIAELGLDFTVFKEIEDFVSIRRVGKNIDAKMWAHIFNSIKKNFAAKNEALKSVPKYSSWQKAELASDLVQSYLKVSQEAHNFYKDYHPEYHWWMQEPAKELFETLEKYKTNLKNHYQNTEIKDDGSGIIGKPIGRQNLINELKFEFIPYSPEDLLSIAENQFEWCETEMKKASREMGFGEDWKKALEKVKNAYVPPGQWPEDVNFLANEAIDFLEKRDLITIPAMAKETWRMVMLSAEAQKQSPFFLGGEQIMVAYPTIDMNHELKMMSMRGNNPHFSRATVQHELIPGHHLQQFMNQRYKPYRRAFYTPFWTEGWALYWEFNLWDKKFPQSPEDKIGMLFWRMHRCARILFSLNYHLGNMSPQQCVNLLVDKVGHERANAEAEVRRSFMGSYGPLYQIAYMLGGLQFYALKAELVDSGKMKEKDFHDRIMQLNSIPVELVRATLKNEKLNKDFQTVWKFK
jgi:uncharacterized protein (DUF885 family)